MKNTISIRKKRFFSLFAAMVILVTSIGVTENHSAAAGYPYLIKVNKAACTITIYKKDAKGNYTVPVKAMLCSPGWATPIGTFRTPAKYRWKELDGPSWGQYSTRITGGILFHSVWYYEPRPDALAIKEFVKLGTICSHGCIRVNVEDAKWIYDNCPIGTTVTIYNDSKNPGPLGKPEAIKLPVSTGRGYDPTDIWTASNPYNKKKPTISGAKNQTVQSGASIDIKKGVTAKTTTGVDATSKIKTTIKYNNKTVKSINTKQAGKYKVTYSVTDVMGRSAKKTITVTVKGNNIAPKLTGVKNMTVGNIKLTHDFLVKNVKATWDNKTLSKNEIKTTVKKVKDNVYQVTYKVTAPNGKSTEKKATITMDVEGPVIHGVMDKEIKWGTKVTKAMALKGITATDNLTPKKKITLDAEITEDFDHSQYKIVYTAKDQYGNETKETAYYVITDMLRITGAKDRTISSLDILDKTFAMKGVKAYNGDESANDDVEVTIVEEEEGVYQIIYTLEDTRGNKAEVTVYFTVKDPEKTPQPSPTPNAEDTQEPSETDTPAPTQTPFPIDTQEPIV